MSVYSLREHLNTFELHIFEGTPTEPNRCQLEKSSRCGNIELRDVEKTSRFACISAQEMRVRCAEIGAKVCGTCISTLYAPFDGEE